MSEERNNGGSGPRTLTVPGVTRLYGWSRSRTYELLGEKHLRGVKLGTRLLILADSCEEVVASLPAAVIRPPRKVPFVLSPPPPAGEVPRRRGRRRKVGPDIAATASESKAARRTPPEQGAADTT